MFVYLPHMLPTSISDKRILLSVLNWGMGHVSRSIGLVDQLIQQGNTVVIACDEKQRGIFSQYFDTVEFIEHQGYPFQFGGKGRFGWDLTKDFFSLYRAVSNEPSQVDYFVGKYQIDIVLSDHRYGFRSTKAPSIFITHQVSLPLRWYTVLAGRLHRTWMNKFTHIWVMDTQSNPMAGRLSNPGKLKNAHYIGWYSRFSLYSIPSNKTLANVLVASGPLIYAQQLVDAVTNSWNVNDELLVLCDEAVNVPAEFQKVSGDWRKQDEILLEAQHVISRSGYSTLMDIAELKCKSRLIPTPGQAEQVYLASLHENQKRTIFSELPSL